MKVIKKISEVDDSFEILDKTYHGHQGSTNAGAFLKMGASYVAYSHFLPENDPNCDPITNILVRDLDVIWKEKYDASRPKRKSILNFGRRRRSKSVDATSAALPVNLDPPNGIVGVIAFF